MRNRTNLSQAQITKVLRTLEGRKLIKVEALTMSSLHFTGTTMQRS